MPDDIQATDPTTGTQPAEAIAAVTQPTTETTPFPVEAVAVAEAPAPTPAAAPLIDTSTPAPQAPAAAPAVPAGGAPIVQNYDTWSPSRLIAEGLKRRGR